MIGDRAGAQDFNEQALIHSDDSLHKILLLAAHSFSKLCAIRIEYPESDKRSITDGAALRVARELFKHVARVQVPSLCSLSIHQMEFEDLSDYDTCVEENITQPLRLFNLTSLKAVFRDSASEGHRFSNLADLAGQVGSHHPLPCLVTRCENLTSLSIAFNKLDKRTRFADWTSLNLTHLETLEFWNLEISEQSILAVMMPSADTLSKLTLDKIFLFDGTWASVYHSLVDVGRIMEMITIGGSEYLDNQSHYSENDAASFQSLFKVVEARRSVAGLHSMRDPAITESKRHRLHFWNMEKSMDFRWAIGSICS